MMNMLRKTTASMAKNGGSKPTDNFDVIEDLTTWEFVSPSLSDDEDLYSFDSDGTIAENQEEEEDLCDMLHLDDIISMQSLSVSPPPVVCFPVEDVIRVHVYDDPAAYDDYENDDDGVCDDDVDDELIPWQLKDRFGKQRIRKMGKRGGPKVSKSKRLPHYHNRPGCLYGKHGLGVQHSYI